MKLIVHRGDAAKLPQDITLRQKYSFTVDSKNEYVKEDGELSKKKFGD
jgi:hypothetical protein